MKQTVIFSTKCVITVSAISFIVWLIFPFGYFSKIFLSKPNQLLIFQQLIHNQRTESSRSGHPRTSKVPIYIITPTYTRLVQKAELTRLSYCLRLVPNVRWIVVEDSEVKSELVSTVLHKSKVSYTHLNVQTPAKHRLEKNEPSWLKYKGILQRNLGLDWLRNTSSIDKDVGVVYFADDDNIYDLELFEEMRQTQKVSVWPVGLVGGLVIEKPTCRDGKVVGWNAVFRKERMFPIDMAGFAINLKLILRRQDAEFSFSAPIGSLESEFLKQLVTVEELEPRADNCSKVLVWHINADKPNLNKEKKLKVPSDLNIEV